MNDKIFIENSRLLSSFRFHLKKMNQESLFGYPLFKHSKTNAIWEKGLEFDYQDPKSKRNVWFRKLPYPSTKELLEIVIYSNSDEQVIGAARLMWYLETKGLEFRESLIGLLESGLGKINNDRILLILDKIPLEDNSNLRDSLNKSKVEVEKDYNYYIDLAKRAIELKKTAANNV